MAGTSLVGRKKPQRKTIRIIRKAVQARLEGNLQTWQEVCDKLNTMGFSITPSVLSIYMARYPDVYRSAVNAILEKMGQEASREVARQRIKSITSAVRMADKADSRLETIIDDDEVSPAVHVDAIKHVHSTIGMGQKGESVVSGSFSAPKDFTDRGKELLAAYGFGVLTAQGEKQPPIEAEVEEINAEEAGKAIEAGGAEEIPG